MRAALFVRAIVVPTNLPGVSGRMDQSVSSLLSLAIIAVAFYVIMIRPQQKRQKEHQALMASLAIGDRVITIGGAYGVVATLDEGRVGVTVSPGVVIEFDRAAIARRLED